LHAAFRHLRRRALQSLSARGVAELGRWRSPGWNGDAELGEEPLKAGGCNGAQQSRRRVGRVVAEGRTVIDVAGQAGHSPETCLCDYAHLFAEFDQGCG
jgi:hypothetical protein